MFTMDEKEKEKGNVKFIFSLFIIIFRVHNIIVLSLDHFTEESKQRGTADDEKRF